jgi:hypothetical protein
MPTAFLAGIQAQTAECLVVGEITAKDLVVALNKVCLGGEGGQGRWGAVRLSCLLESVCVTR